MLASLRDLAELSAARSLEGPILSLKERLTYRVAGVDPRSTPRPRPGSGLTAARTRPGKDGLGGERALEPARE